MIRFKMNGFIALVLVEMLGFGISIWTSLVPVILMAMYAIVEMILPKGHAFLPIAKFLGDPIMATLIAVLIAMFTFDLNRGRSMDQIDDTLFSSIKIISMMLLIIGGRRVQAGAGR